MSKWPSVQPCTDCAGNPATPAPQQQFPSVPTCPEEVATHDSSFCNKTTGKFYDKLIKKFVVPTSGTTGDMYVCDPTRWTGCNWVAVCYPNKDGNQIAIFKVLDINIPNKFIRVFNACSSGDPITDNPDPGTTFDKDSIIYAVPPPWCKDELCQKITDAIEDGDCACAAVATCLANSDEICFTNIPEVGEGEEVHLFGGIIDSLTSCFRKIVNIITGDNGNTLCFPEIPETTDDDEVIEGSPVEKHLVYITNAGCLKKGASIKASSCSDDTDIGEDDRTFDKLIVCKDGIKRTIPPLDANESIIAGKNDADIPFWKIVSNSATFHFLSTVQNLVDTTDDGVDAVNVTLNEFPDTDLNLNKIFAVFRCAGYSYRSGGSAGYAIAMWNHAVTGADGTQKAHDAIDNIDKLLFLTGNEVDFSSDIAIIEVTVKDGVINIYNESDAVRIKLQLLGYLY